MTSQPIERPFRLAMWIPGVALVAVASWESGADELQGIHDETEGVYRVEWEGQTVSQYRFEPNPYKPYVDHFETPGGHNVLRDAPADHPHHHGLMFAASVNGVNFWEEHEAADRQVPRDEGSVQQPACGAAYTHVLDWLPEDAGAPILTEERSITWRRRGDEGNLPALLTWTSALTVPEDGEPAELEGDHYHGLGARFLEVMDDGGAFLSPVDEEPEHVRGSEYLVRAPWQAYTAEVNGDPVTIAMFCRPTNRRHPAWWFIMDDPFAYLAATLRLHEQPLPLEPGETLELVYGVALWDGAKEEETIESAYQAWLEQQ